MRIAQLGPVLLLLSTFCLCGVPDAAAETDFVRSVPGSLVLAGHGDVPDVVMDVFLHLSGSPGARVLVVATEAKPRSLERWRNRGALSAAHIDKRTIEPRRLTLAMLSANAVWFEDAAESLRKNELFAALLRGLLERGGVVGGGGQGALALAVRGQDGHSGFAKPGFGLLPSSAVQLVGGSALDASSGSTKVVKGGDGLVCWQIPNETALVVHHGRRVAAYGKDRVVPRIPAHKDWPERRRMIPVVGTFRFGDALPHELDLLSWIRSAHDRQGPPFPSEKRERVELEKGTLVLSGGGRVQDETFEAFIEAAGGKQARFVCIPSADDFGPGERVRSYSARRLREIGCENVFIIHTADPRQAERDPRLLGQLESADGVWIDGGRTYRVIDALHGTRAHALIRDVLARGKAVGGSSAGCQVVGAFLVRGDPRTNNRLVFDGYTRGLGFLPGTVLDAHFRQRNREKPLRDLITETPQLMGIGIDKDTAIVIRKHEARVLGEHAVTFYASHAKEVRATQLKAGDAFDLVKRRKID